MTMDYCWICKDTTLRSTGELNRCTKCGLEA